MISIVLIPFLIILFTGRAVSAAPSSPLYAESKHSIRSHIDPTLIRNSPAQRSAFLQAHNNVRTRYHAAPLLWSVFLAQLAEEWADACYFKHTNGILRDKPYGENIVAATGDFSVQSAVATFIQDKSECCLASGYIYLCSLQLFHPFLTCGVISTPPPSLTRT